MRTRQIGRSDLDVSVLGPGAAPIFAAREMVGSLWPTKELGANAFVGIQNECSLVGCEPDRGAVPAALKHSIGFLPFFPLAMIARAHRYKPSRG